MVFRRIGYGVSPTPYQMFDWYAQQGLVHHVFADSATQEEKLEILSQNQLDLAVFSKKKASVQKRKPYLSFDGLHYEIKDPDLLQIKANADKAVKIPVKYHQASVNEIYWVNEHNKKVVALKLALVDARFKDMDWTRVKELRKEEREKDKQAQLLNGCSKVGLQTEVDQMVKQAKKEKESASKEYLETTGNRYFPQDMKKARSKARQEDQAENPISQRKRIGEDLDDNEEYQLFDDDPEGSETDLQEDESDDWDSFGAFMSILSEDDEGNE